MRRIRFLRGYGDEESLRMLEEAVEAAVESLAAEARRDTTPSDFLSNILGIRQVRRLVGGKWETLHYELLVVSGGPTIWVRTDGIVEAFWGDTELVAEITDKKILGFLREVEDSLEEAAEC